MTNTKRETEFEKPEIEARIKAYKSMLVTGKAVQLGAFAFILYILYKMAEDFTGVDKSILEAASSHPSLVMAPLVLLVALTFPFYMINNHTKTRIWLDYLEQLKAESEGQARERLIPDEAIEKAVNGGGWISASFQAVFLVPAVALGAAFVETLISEGDKGMAELVTPLALMVLLAAILAFYRIQGEKSDRMLLALRESEKKTDMPKTAKEIKNE